MLKTIQQTMKYLQALVSVLLILGCNMTPPSDVELSEELECRPSFIPIGEQPIRHSAEGRKLQFKVIVIGCESHLEQITQEELSEVSEILQNSLAELDLIALALNDFDDLRKKIVQRISESIGRKVITELYVSETYFSESRALH